MKGHEEVFIRETISPGLWKRHRVRLQDDSLGSGKTSLGLETTGPCKGWVPLGSGNVFTNSPGTSTSPLRRQEEISVLCTIIPSL